MRNTKRKARDAWRLVEAAVGMIQPSSRMHWQIASHLEEVQIHTELSNDYSDDVVATGDWNTVDQWDDALKRRVSVPYGDLPKRLGDALERIGVALEWSDQASTCSHCGKLVQTSPDSYSWTPQYTVGDGELSCLSCVEDDAEEHLRSLEGNPRSANTIRNINPAKHGYVCYQDDFEAGYHPGQDASPEKIGESLEKLGVERYLFQIDGKGQFDTRFSVWVHEDDVHLLEAKEKLDRTEYDGPSNSQALDRGLRAASASMAKLEGDGVKYVAISGDEVTDARVISPRDFIEKGTRK